MNNFEKHLKANKEKLNLDKVNPEIWLSIENDVLKKKNRRGRYHLKLLGAVAAVLLLLVIALNGFYNKENRDIHAQLIELYDLQEHNFTQKISTKKARLAKAKIPKDREEDFQLLLNQLQFLDEQYINYLNYIEVNGYQDFIGNQILTYYKSKIELLDKIQSEIKKIERYENKYDANSPTVELNL